jgi:hypothetical protein
MEHHWMDENDLCLIWLVQLCTLYQQAIRSKFASPAQPELAWGNHKRAASYNWVEACVVVLKNGAILDG